MLSNNRPKVLVVAGLDSGGGAGITADTLTVHDNGGYALACTTALTAQSLKKVASVVPTDDAIFKESLDLVVQDWNELPKAVKVGLVSAQSTLDILLKFLKTKLKGVPVVWDPVLTATAGHLKSADLKTNLDKILDLTTIFTPNIPEALELASWTEQDLKDKGVKELASFFLKKGLKSILIKGGHGFSENRSSDYFCDGKTEFFMESYRKPGDGAHGGGCALSSALAALIAQGYELHDAAVVAKSYVFNGILNPAIEDNEYRPPIGHNGFTDNIKFMPRINESGFPTSAMPFAPCPFKMGLYPVVDDIKWIERLLVIGVKTIQLRIKDKREDLYEQIQRAVQLGKRYKARVFIDDHYELAIKAGAYGVHLGMEDLRTADIEKIRTSGLRLGVSTHGMYELLKAVALKPSYIALGHIFPTQTKVMPSKPQGVSRLAFMAKLLDGIIPTVAIGGIKYDSLTEILNTNVGSVAVVTAITKAEDPLVETQKWLVSCGNGGSL